jgi:GTP-binding protein HflX
MPADGANGTPAIVAKHADEPPVETTEIRALAEAAGYEVVGEVTQARAEDPGSHFGAGKVADLAALADETGARVVVVDGELSPAQTHELQQAMPEGTRVLDRYRLVLEVFGERADTRRGKLQVELARLQYDLPRMREAADEGLLNRSVEKGSPLYDVADRIDRLEAKLDALPDPAEAFRERRREEGFDLVTLAGYTNAGKSTLLHRLADDLDPGDVKPDHPDREATASVAGRLFETLETTTRRATLGGRPVLLTDTVGFVSDLPHWLVESFSETLSEAAAADAVILVADASDPLPEFREKLRVSLDVLDAQVVPREAIVTALNKADLLDADERERRIQAASEIAPAPLPVSAVEGENVDALVGRVRDRLPTERATLEMPTCDDAMAVVSWAYDRATVEDVSYDAGTVSLALVGRPDVVERARAKAEEVRSQTSK